MKDFEFKIDELLLSKIVKPIRSKLDAIILLIETLRYILWNKPDNQMEGNIKIIISKMRRIFYITETQIFSITIPFEIRINTDGYLEIYDENDAIDSKYLSILRSFFDGLSDSNMLYQLSNDGEDDTLDKNDISTINRLIKKLILSENGYLRYDDDTGHENGDMHPRFHIDINYSNNSTYKLGLENGVDFAWICDCVDITKPCKYIKV